MTVMAYVSLVVILVVLNVQAPIHALIVNYLLFWLMALALLVCKDTFMTMLLKHVLDAAKSVLPVRITIQIVKLVQLDFIC